MSGPFPAPRDGHHVVIFVIDVSTTEEFLEHIKLAVSAALEVLPPHALVGLISAADHVRHHSLCCAVLPDPLFMNSKLPVAQVSPAIRAG